MLGYVECFSQIVKIFRVLHILGETTSSGSRSQIFGHVGQTVARELSLLRDKLDKLYDQLTQFNGRKHANKRQLLSLAGILSHCARLVRGGRTFSRRVINLANYLPELKSVICLPDWFRDDLVWWSKFAECFNGKVRFMDKGVSCHTHVYTDTSLSGFGAAFGQDWYVGTWLILGHKGLDGFPRGHIEECSEEWQDNNNINVMELWPVLCAVRRWGAQMRDTGVTIRSDNSQVVTMLNTGRSGNVKCMRWLREIFWLSFIFNVQLVGIYIKSTDNTIADYLSCATNCNVRENFGLC